jgi:hypothetical protein
VSHRAWLPVRILGDSEAPQIASWSVPNFLCLNHLPLQMSHQGTFDYIVPGKEEPGSLNPVVWASWHLCVP